MSKQKELAVPYLPGSNQHNTKNNLSGVKVSTSRLTDEKVNEIGEEKYEKQFASVVETEENCGKFFLLDVVTDVYEVGDNLLMLLKNAKKRNPDDNIYVRRIGHSSVFRLH